MPAAAADTLTVEHVTVILGDVLCGERRADRETVTSLSVVNPGRGGRSSFDVVIEYDGSVSAIDGLLNRWEHHPS